MATPNRPERADLPYLRRRIKPTAAQDVRHDPAPRTEAPGTPTRGLSLARPSASSPPERVAPVPRAAPSGLLLGHTGSAAVRGATGSPAPAAKSAPRPQVAPETLPFAAPSIDDVRELGDEHPVLRLNARESAIGTLIVTGAAFIIWEDRERVTGCQTPEGQPAGSLVTTSGNRPLVGFDRADALVSLRHVRELRRALFVPSGGELLGAQIFDGSTVTVAPGDETRTYALSLLRVENLLELRAEPFERSADAESLLQQFGYELTPTLTPRTARSR